MIGNIKKLAKEPLQIAERQSSNQTGTSITMYESCSGRSWKHFECFLEGEQPTKPEPEREATLGIELNYAGVNGSKRRVSSLHTEGVIDLCAGRRNS